MGSETVELVRNSRIQNKKERGRHYTRARKRGRERERENSPCASGTAPGGCLAVFVPLCPIYGSPSAKAPLHHVDRAPGLPLAKAVAQVVAPQVIIYVPTHLHLPVLQLEVNPATLVPLLLLLLAGAPDWKSLCAIVLCIQVAMKNSLTNYTFRSMRITAICSIPAARRSSKNLRSSESPSIYRSSHTILLWK
ncbi:uncharacterized protein G2W53_001063 [Senna tora]|uniref:Uncharacterized protein n=1 Tax=Senna tora TaxID=362788 RepID=A0A834XGI0_9FABA|nr:uncharacterized protein G2W53_001063 [Senna tora]